MKNVIEVSFKKSTYEQELLREIKKRTVILGDSGWMKMAAAEKIEREANQEIKIIDDFIKGN